MTKRSMRHSEAAKGPHGGRLLTQDDFLALEVTIYETEVEPRFPAVFRRKTASLSKTTALKLQSQVTAFRRTGRAPSNSSPELDYWLG